jgi:small subunit ribosomal protein S17
MSDEKKVRAITGKVVSNKMDKSITVSVERRVKHPLYGKYITRTNKLHVHDENNICNEGDIVTVQECAPISKTKFWTLLQVEKPNAAV